MDDFFESQALTIVGKNCIAHGNTIEMAGWTDHLFAESGPDLIEGRLPGCDHLAGDDVGIDNRNAVLCEHVGDKGFAAGNAAGQANTKSGLSGRLSHSEHCV